MKILHVNYYDDRGGAGRAAQRLHRGLLNAGHDSLLLVARQETEVPQAFSLVSKNKQWRLSLAQRIDAALKDRKISVSGELC